MTTLQNMTLSEPTGVSPVPHPTMAYFRFRLKQRMLDLILREFKKSGLSKADLARRLDKEPAQVSRILSGPGNLTLETISDVLFASSGAELSSSVQYPLKNQVRFSNAAGVVLTSTPKRILMKPSAGGIFVFDKIEEGVS